MRVYFVRHGEAEGNVNMVCHGQYDGKLTQKGRKQAALTAQALRGVNFDSIYSSGLQRAYDTALAIAQGRGVSVIKDAGLCEISLGEWENKSWDYIDANYKEEYGLWKTKPHLMKSPGGESMPEVQERITAAVRRILDKTGENDTICIVSHCCALKNLLCYYLKRPLSRLNDIWITNASYSIVDFTNGEAEVLSISCDEHLKELGVIAAPPWNENSEKEK